MAVDLESAQGQRDHLLLLFLYNTGARADEAAQVLVGDLNLAHVPRRDLSWVKIRGKGNKLRHCPLWPQTVNELAAAIEGRVPGERVFLNRYGRPITRFGVYDLVTRYVRRAVRGMPSLATKDVSPHTIRRSTATHLLRGGVDINTVRDWFATFPLTQQTSTPGAIWKRKPSHTANPNQQKQRSIGPKTRDP